MPSDVLIPVAEYVRMSTEHQQYSLDNQRAAIQSYAERAGTTVVISNTHSSRCVPCIGLLPESKFLGHQYER